MRSAAPHARIAASIGVDDDAKATVGTAAVRRAHQGCLPHTVDNRWAAPHVGLGLRAARAAAAAPPV